jgi:hypothetical protein
MGFPARFEGGPRDGEALILESDLARIAFPLFPAVSWADHAEIVEPPAIKAAIYRRTQPGCYRFEGEERW